MAATSGSPSYKKETAEAVKQMCNSILSNKAGNCEVCYINILAVLRNTVHLQLKNRHYGLSSYIDSRIWL
jgi:UDP-glucose 6-dehydrogenase